MLRGLEVTGGMTIRSGFSTVSRLIATYTSPSAAGHAVPHLRHRGAVLALDSQEQGEQCHVTSGIRGFPADDWCPGYRVSPCSYGPRFLEKRAVPLPQSATGIACKTRL